MTLHGEIEESVRIAFSSVYANKMRSVLATLGIVIGVVTVSLMSMAIDGVYKSFMRGVSMLGSDVVYVERDNWMEHGDWWKTRGRREITLEQAKRMIRLAGDRYVVSPYVSHQMCTIKYNTENVSGVMMEGAMAETAVINSFEMADGRFYDNKEVDGARPVCVLGDDTVQNYIWHWVHVWRTS